MQSVSQKYKLGAWEQHGMVGGIRSLLGLIAKAHHGAAAVLRAACSSLQRVLHYAFSQLKGMRRLLNTVFACSTENHLAGGLPFPCPALPGVQGA